MSTPPFRVVVWSTGWIGSSRSGDPYRARARARRRLGAQRPTRTGATSASSRRRPIGLAATDDAEALVAQRPDCVVYAASGPELDAAAVPDYVRMLAAGVDVVTVSSWAGLVFPPGFEPTWRAAGGRRGRSGGATLYASGIEPGFAGDQLVLTLATQSDRSARSAPRSCSCTTPIPWVHDERGHGLRAAARLRGDVATRRAALGVGSGHRPHRRRVAGRGRGDPRAGRPGGTDRTLEVACGTIEAGTCGAIRMQAIGMVHGREAIVIEHVNRMAEDLAPEWPIGNRDGTYRILIEGDPDIECDMAVGIRSRRAAGAWSPLRCAS